MKRGEIWWTNLGAPSGSEPGYRRPAVIVSANDFNKTPIKTLIVVFFTTNSVRAGNPGNLWLTPRQTGLPQPSTLNITHILTVDRRVLAEKVGRLSDAIMAEVDDGLRLVMAL